MDDSNRYTAEAFLKAAARVEGLTRDECHPSLYNRRRWVADNLRRMAEDPTNPAYVRAMNALRLLFDYTETHRK